MCMYMYVHIYVCVCVRVHVYVCIYIDFIVDNSEIAWASPVLSCSYLCCTVL